MKKLVTLLLLSATFVFGYGQGLETFDNFDASGSSYLTGTFTGQDGSTWTYTQCRGDSPIDGKAIMIGRNRSPQSNFYSGTIPNGVGIISFDFKQAFSTNVNLNVMVNEIVVGNVTTSGEQNVIKNSGDFTVNVAGDVVIKFINANNSDGQVVVDNVSWTAFAGGGALPPSISDIEQFPASDITSTTTVAVSAEVTEGDAAIAEVLLQWGTSSGDLPNEISMSLNTKGTYLTDADIPAQPDGTTVFFTIYAEDADGESTTSAEQSYTVQDPAMTTLPYMEPFDNDLGDCYVYSVSGPNREWNWNAGGWAQMNGFNTGDIEEDWLILPGIEMDDDNVVMNFNTWWRFGSDDDNNYLKLFYSTDYSGIGDPTSATWTELSYLQPETQQTWSTSGDIALSGITGTVWIGFKYRYEPGNYRLWQVDDLNVIEVDFPPAAMPEFSVPSGEYFAAFNLEITSTTPDAVIYYTDDGTDPDDNSNLYVDPLLINASVTIKAIAYAPDHTPSSIATADYTFIEPAFADIPYFEPFDADLGDCYVYSVSGPNREWEWHSSGSAQMNGFNTGDIEEDWLILPGIDIQSEDVILTFETAYNFGSDNDNNYLKLFYSNDYAGVGDPTTASWTELDFTQPASGGYAWASSGSISFSEVTGLTWIGFKYRYEPGNYRLWRVDNINIEEVPPTITVISPNGGEQIEQDTEFEIEWSAVNYDGDVEVVLHAPLVKENVELGVVPAADGSFTWNVTQDLGEYVIIVKAFGQEEPWDMSDEPFNIVPAIDIKITEIMYNPPESGADSLEFIEFYNNGVGVVNMLDWTISNAVSFTFPEVELQPGEYLLVAVNATAFLNTFGMEVLQWAGGALGNSGNTIELKDNIGNIRAFVAYQNGGDWPFEAAGFGPSIEFCNPGLENNDPANWTASTVLAAINANGAGIYCTPGNGCNESLALPMLYSAGWGGISSNLVPGRMSMEELFAPVYDNLVILLGKEGIFWPGQNINTIGDWNTYEGYKAKFDGITYFSYPGYAPESRMLNLEPGIQFIPVLSENPASVEELIMPLGDAIEFMFDISQGLIYWPFGGIVPGTSEQALNTLFPGYAYLTKVNYATTIDFGETPTKIVVENTSQQFVNNTTWNDVNATGTQHIISIAASALQNLQSGDVIGVFNDQQECVGMSGFGGEETVLPLIVHGDDMTTKSIDGMMADELMNIKIFRNGETIETEAVYSNQTSHSNGLFAENGLSIITGLKAGSTGVSELTGGFSVYPNPSSGTFNIDVDGTFEVSVTNIQGQLVYSGAISGKAQIDLGAQPDGVYIIKLHNATKTLIERIIVR